MRLTVNATRKYDILTENSFSQIKKEICTFFNGKKILIVTDSIVEKLYLNQLMDNLKDYEVFSYVLPAGESSKNPQNYLKILTYLAEKNFLRKDMIIALGGGVVGDLAGFVASSYMRGIVLVQCPTTLLASVDSSVGGKTGVDLPQGKNLVGAFYQPFLTYVNLSTFSSLPEREIKCGLGEVVKYAFISSSITEEMLKKGITEELIIECVKIKAQIVSEDEFDNGKRALLNLGHTIGHAIESLANYSLSHGACVSKGIAKIIDMSAKYYNLSDKKRLELRNILSYSGEDEDILFDTDKIIEKIALDKKAENNGVNLVLIKDIGDVRIEKLSIEKIRELML